MGTPIVREVRCGSLLNRSTGARAGLTLNAYQGCAFGCSYCYVPQMRRRRGQIDATPWGYWIDAKVNAPEVFAREMRRVPALAHIAIGTASDSWQPIEKHYEISRRLLLVLLDYPNSLSIVTRSPLLIRDIGLLQRLESVTVGVSLPTFDDAVRRVFEPHAPSVAGRSELVRRLVAAGIRTLLFWCPILPGVADTETAVRAYMEGAARLGVSHVVWDTLNYVGVLGPRYDSAAEAAAQLFGGERRLSRPELAAAIARWSSSVGIPAG